MRAADSLPHPVNAGTPQAGKLSSKNLCQNDAISKIKKVPTLSARLGPCSEGAAGELAEYLRLNGIVPPCVHNLKGASGLTA